MLFAKQNNESWCGISIACSYKAALYGCTGCALKNSKGRHLH